MSKQSELRRLDERAATAATDLRRRAERRPAPAFDPDRGEALAPPAPAHEPRPRRPLLAAAAVLAVLAGGLAWWSLGEGAGEEDSLPVTSTAGPRPHIATDLPAGLAPAGFLELTATTSERRSPAGPLVLYGPAVDQPRLGVVHFDELWPGLEESAETVQVGGLRALVIQGLEDRALAVPLDDGGAVLAISRALGRDELAAVLAAATVEGGRATVDASALPEDWTPVGEADAMEVVFGRVPMDGFMAMYGTMGVEGDDLFVQVHASAGEEGEVFGNRLVLDPAREADVGGQRALVGTYPNLPEDAPPARMVIWQDSPGVILRVVGVNLSTEELLSVAESVEPVDQETWDDLVERTQLGDFRMPGDEQDAELLAEGRFAGGTAWKLRLLTNDDSGRSTELSVAVGGSGGSSGSSSSGGPGPFPSIETLDRGGRHFASGLLSDGVATVELRRPDGSVIARPELVGTDEHRAWVAELTEDPTVVVALDAAGRELGRSTIEELGENQSVSVEEPTPTTTVTPDG